MTATFAYRLVLSTAFIISALPQLPAICAAPWDPAAADYTGHKGKTLYVSKQGNNTDGGTWATAFQTIQAALTAVPDALGGHRIIVRPDTYVEANFSTAHKGAEGSYNELIGDCSGKLGSGATGRVIIDSGDPKKGFKSFDWWSTIRATSQGWAGRPEHSDPTFSSICWDRWILRNLYTSGSDAGFFWDLTDKSGEGFTVIVEDCVGIGRAFGGGVCYPIVRPKEPSVFRRNYFMSLDWVGDTAAVLVGGAEKTMPEHPHLVMEDCTLVNPDNALAASYASQCVRVKMTGCRLIALNFTQPEMGGLSTGIICTEGGPSTGTRKLHVDLEDCILAGYSVFTPGEKSKLATYTTKGKVQAYLQFKQPAPQGFEQLGLWPAQLFDRIAPPQPTGIGK